MKNDNALGLDSASLAALLRFVKFHFTSPSRFQLLGTKYSERWIRFHDNYPKGVDIEDMMKTLGESRYISVQEYIESNGVDKLMFVKVEAVCIYFEDAPFNKMFAVKTGSEVLFLEEFIDRLEAVTTGFWTSSIPYLYFENNTDRLFVEILFD